MGDFLSCIRLVRHHFTERSPRVAALFTSTITIRNEGSLLPLLLFFCNSLALLSNPHCSAFYFSIFSYWLLQLFDHPLLQSRFDILSSRINYYFCLSGIAWNLRALFNWKLMIRFCGLSLHGFLSRCSSLVSSTLLTLSFVVCLLSFFTYPCSSFSDWRTSILLFL